MREIITLLDCITPIIKKKAKTTSNNNLCTTRNERKNYDVGT